MVYRPISGTGVTQPLRHSYAWVDSHSSVQLYGWVGRCSDMVMVNSSWTEEHINELWLCPLKTHRVYPPCDVEDLKKLPLLSENSNSQNSK